MRMKDWATRIGFLLLLLEKEEGQFPHSLSINSSPWLPELHCCKPWSFEHCSNQFHCNFSFSLLSVAECFLMSIPQRYLHTLINFFLFYELQQSYPEYSYFLTVLKLIIGKKKKSENKLKRQAKLEITKVWFLTLGFREKSEIPMFPWSWSQHFQLLKSFPLLFNTILYIKAQR